VSVRGQGSAAQIRHPPWSNWAKRSSSRCPILKYLALSSFISLLFSGPVCATTPTFTPIRPLQKLVDDWAAPDPSAFSVTPMGVAIWSMPIWIPQGRNGIQPALAITYRSVDENRLVGLRFSLDGFSSISRCWGTPAQDGHYSATSTSGLPDKFCLNGHRLIPRPLSAPNLLQPEFDSSVLVEVEGSLLDPDYFIVYRSSGGVEKFGWRDYQSNSGLRGRPVITLRFGKPKGTRFHEMVKHILALALPLAANIGLLPLFVVSLLGSVFSPINDYLVSKSRVAIAAAFGLGWLAFTTLLSVETRSPATSGSRILPSDRLGEELQSLTDERTLELDTFAYSRKIFRGPLIALLKALMRSDHPPTIATVLCGLRASQFSHNWLDSRFLVLSLQLNLLLTCCEFHLGRGEVWTSTP
jgi:hypothetical protein